MKALKSDCLRMKCDVLADLPVHGTWIRWNWTRGRSCCTCTGSFSEAMCRKCAGRAKQKALASNSSSNNNKEEVEVVLEEGEKEGEEAEEEGEKKIKRRRGKSRGNRSWPLNGTTVACHQDEWIFTVPLRLWRVRNKRMHTKMPEKKGFDVKSTVSISIRAEAFMMTLTPINPILLRLIW